MSLETEEIQTHGQINIIIKP